MKNRTTSIIRTAPKGRHISAQGNALGQGNQNLSAPWIETPMLMEKEENNKIRNNELEMKNRTTSDLRTALKGRHISAQGNALGQGNQNLSAPWIETPMLMEKKENNKIRNNE